MLIEEEIRHYLANATRRRQLVRLELMAARPSLAQRRSVRPRLGLIRRLLRLIVR